MSQDEKQTAGENKSDKPKKAYKKPEFRYERVFETMALACGKISHTQFECHVSKKRS